MKGCAGVPPPSSSRHWSSWFSPPGGPVGSRGRSPREPAEAVRTPRPPSSTPWRRSPSASSPTWARPRPASTTWPGARATASPSRPPPPTSPCPAPTRPSACACVGSEPVGRRHHRRPPPRPHQLPHRRRPVGLADGRPHLRPGHLRRRVAGRRPRLPRRPAPPPPRLRGRAGRRPVHHRRRLRRRRRPPPSTPPPATCWWATPACPAPSSTRTSTAAAGRSTAPSASSGGRPASVGFTVGAYDRTRPLVIDPTLVTSSYLGGSGIDNAAAVDVDGGGNVYIAGSTESADFRATNPFQNTLNGDGSAGQVRRLRGQAQRRGHRPPLRHLPGRHQPGRGRGRGRRRRRQRVRHRRHRVGQLPQDRRRGPGRTTAAGPATPSSPSSTRPGRAWPGRRSSAAPRPTRPGRWR